MTASELKNRYPYNTVLTDEAGNPSVMVYIPAFSLADVIPGAPCVPHPAFVVEGKALPGIFISKFQNVIVHGIACSLPHQDPATRVNFDDAVRACTAKGKGWHLMTAMEWGMIALWCQKNGFLPFGNNGEGFDVREPDRCATVSYRNEEKGICRTATGSGPVSWNHNGREDGICDLNGNVWEWNGGIRVVRGELQLLPDNNGANDAFDQGADSADWRAVDARTGEYIAPHGEGDAEHSVKLDFVNGAFAYVADAVQDAYPHARFCDFSAVRAADGISEQAQWLLQALGCLPTGDLSLVADVSLYANNGSAERMVFRGGRWGQGLNAGVFKTCIDDPRTYAGEAVGFRAAYYEAD